jgi:integrase
MRIPKVPTYLVKSLNSRYYFRIVVPADVRQALGGQREFRRALGTTDMRKALPLAWGMAAEYLRLFKRCRMGKDPNDPLKDAVLSTELLVERKIAPDGTVTENIIFDDPDVQKDKERLKAYEELQREHDNQPFRHSVRADLNRVSIHNRDVSSPKGFRKRSSTIDSESPSSQEHSHLKLSELVAQYSAERINKGYWSPNTAAENVEAYKKLVKLLGDRPIDTYDRSDANLLLTKLQNTKSKKGGTLKPSVVNKKIGMISSLFKYANRIKIYDQNSFEQMQMKVTGKAEDAWGAYEDAELKKLFDPNYFRIDAARPSRFWIPLLMAVGGGGRPGELAQITVDDVFELDGVICYQINDHMQTKTENSLRTIPVTKGLKEIGFLRFVDQRRREVAKSKSADRRLFVELTADRKKKAGAVSAWWNVTHHKRCNVPKLRTVTLGRTVKESKLSLYSIRHTVQTRLRAAGISETIASEIVGHKKGKGTGYQVYAKSSQLGPLIEALESINYGDIFEKVPVWP